MGEGERPDESRGAGGWGSFALPPTTPTPVGPTPTWPTATWPPQPAPRTGPAGPAPAVWRLALAPVAALAAAVLIGVAVGAVLLFMVSRSQSGQDGWQQLGQALVALVLAFGVGIVAWIVLLVVAARTVLPPGRRAVAVVAAVFSAPALLVVQAIAWTGLRSGSGSQTAVGGLVELAVLVAPSTAFLVAGRGLRAGGRPDGTAARTGVPALVALAVVGVLVASALVVAVVGHGRAQRNADRALARVPYVLFQSADGSTTADPAISTWRRDRLSVTYVEHVGPSVYSVGAAGADQVTLRYFTTGSGAGVTAVSMYSTLTPCSSTVVRGYVCTSAGAASGGELRRYTQLTGNNLYGGQLLVLAFADGSGVSVSIAPRISRSDPGNLAAQIQAELDARTALASVVRVSRTRFEAATGTRLRTY